MRDKQPLCHAEMRFLQVYSGYVDPHMHNSEESLAFVRPQGSNVVETAAIIGCCLVLLTWLWASSRFSSADLLQQGDWRSERLDVRAGPVCDSRLTMGLVRHHANRLHPTM